MVLQLAHCSSPLHQQYVVHDNPLARQLQLDREQGDADLHIHRQQAVEGI